MRSIRLLPFSLIAIGAAALLFGYVNAQAPAAPDNRNIIETHSHRFERITEGVYHFVGTGTVTVMSNGMLLVGENDLLVVDSHVTPDAARHMLEAIKQVSDKPVRYLINTHFHFDHAHGNQIFPPEVEIIGHRFTRQKLTGELGNVLEESTFLSFTGPVPQQITSLERQIAETTDASRKAVLEQQLETTRAYQRSLAEIVPTPPNITIEKEMTLYQRVMHGSREVQLLHHGRGHTGGDLVVYLPEERIIFTGDLLGPSLIYMGDAFALEWADTLEALKSLDIDVILPGHGAPMSGTEKIQQFQDYLRDLWAKTGQLKAQGLTAEQAAERIDMTNHSNNYPQIRGPGADVRAIRRIYELLDA
jgi:cyclase